MLRSYTPADADGTLKLYRDTIRRINSADYAPHQISVWASDEIDLAEWQERFAGRMAYVAESDGHLVGFADMTETGHLDRLFVASDKQRQGIAKSLLAKLKAEAIARKIPVITTDASITARPFFEASGFFTVCQQTVECRGVAFTNYRMKWICVSGEGARTPRVQTSTE